jgi:hypothetical protein
MGMTSITNTVESYLDVSDDLAETIHAAFGLQMRGGLHVQADRNQST